MSNKEYKEKTPLQRMAFRSYIYLGFILTFAFLSILFWALYYYLTQNLAYLILYGISLGSFLLSSILFLFLRAKMIKLANKGED